MKQKFWKRNEQNLRLYFFRVQGLIRINEEYPLNRCFCIIVKNDQQHC